MILLSLSLIILIQKVESLLNVNPILTSNRFEGHKRRTYCKYNKILSSYSSCRSSSSRMLDGKYISYTSSHQSSHRASYFATKNDQEHDFKNEDERVEQQYTTTVDNNDEQKEDRKYTSSEVQNSPTSKKLENDFDADDQKDNKNVIFNTVCRIVANGDGKIPYNIFQEIDFSPYSHAAEYNELYMKMDAIFHARTHAQIKELQPKSHKYNSSIKNLRQEQYQILRSSLENSGYELITQRDLDLCEALNSEYLLRLSILPDLSDLDGTIGSDIYPELYPGFNDDDDSDDNDEIDEIKKKDDRVDIDSSDKHENDLISTTRKRLEKNTISQNKTMSIKSTSRSRTKKPSKSRIPKVPESLLFQGKVLIYRRGYTQEISRGRLILPKLDYLQSTIISKSTILALDKLSIWQRFIRNKISQSSKEVIGLVRRSTSTIYDNIVVIIANLFSLDDFSEADDDLDTNWLSKFINPRKIKVQMSKMLKSIIDTKSNQPPSSESLNNFSKKKKNILGRYGANRPRFVGGTDMMDPLSPFLVCEIEQHENLNSSNFSSQLLVEEKVVLDDAVDHDLYHGLNTGSFNCRYDLMKAPIQQESDNTLQSMSKRKSTPVRLLQRVSIGNLIDFFSGNGHQQFFDRIFSRSELVEPSYEEVVVLWRPKPKKSTKKKASEFFKPPKFIYQVAEVFAIEDRLPQKSKLTPKSVSKSPLEIRSFVDVPMANLQAVLPKTKLIFRPADAFLFDFISVFSLFAVLISQRYDSPRLDLLAIISVSLWFLRTFFRYSNKLARYDLLVNKFLTSKISHRNFGTWQYVMNEAATQRALRASLVYIWMIECYKKEEFEGISRSQLEEEVFLGIHRLMKVDQQIDVDIPSAIDDLTELQLVQVSSDKGIILNVKYVKDAMNILESIWIQAFNSIT